MEPPSDHHSEFSYQIQNDGLTAVPIQFTSKFTPITYPRVWKLKNEDFPWDTTFLGLNPFVVLRKGGNYVSDALISTQLGSKYCSGNFSLRFKIDPLGVVFIPNFIFGSAQNTNSNFKITARSEDDNNLVLREINDGVLTIFNRWGKQIYKFENYNNDLNHDKLKKDLVDGQYFYEFKSDRYNYKTAGSFSVGRD